MSVATTGTGGIAPAFLAMYRNDTLFAAEPLLLHQRFGVKGTIVAGGPQGQSKTVKWRKIGALPTVTSALSEGVNPSSNDMSLTEVEAISYQFGAFVEFSDRVSQTAYDQYAGDTAIAQGHQAGRSIDYFTREVLVAGSSVRYPAGRVDRDEILSTDVITPTQVKKAVRDLRLNDAMGHAELGGAFVGVINPSTEYDLLESTEFKDTVKYNAALVDRFQDLYLGRAFGVEWFRTTHAKVFADAGDTNTDVHVTMIIGARAYGVLDLKSLEYIVNQPGSAGSSDALHLKGTQGWKVDQANKILFESYLCRLEHAATDAA